VNPQLARLLFWVGVLAVAVLAIDLLQGILLPFAASFVIAFFLDPVVDRFERWGVRRWLASFAVLVGFFLVLGFVLVLIVPMVQAQIVQLVARMPTIVSAVQDQLDGLMQLLQEHLPKAELAKLQGVVGDKVGDAVGWMAGLLRNMITSSLAILNIVSLVVITPVVAFFLLRDWDVMIAHIDGHLPRDNVDTIREQARIINDTLAGFVHGQGLVCLILAVYYAGSLTLAGLDSALGLGSLIGLLAVVPVVGATIGFLLAVGLAALQFGDWTSVLIVVGIFLFGQTVEGNFLTPKLVGDRIHLHPVWVIFALLAGGQLFGFVGVLFSVPAAAVLGVLVRFALSRYRMSGFYDQRRQRGR
jgi:predicted PurR-regulated permease PerM